MEGAAEKLVGALEEKEIVSGLPVLDASPMNEVLEVFVKLK